MKITLLPYESCLKIGKEVVNSGNFVHMTYGLPKKVFDGTYEVECIECSDYRVRYNNYACYYVPPIFVSYVSHGN